MKTKRFDSAEGNVWKYVFEFENAVAEAVLYKYNSFKERTVLCISVQSGCPVGCSFCGTGKRFIRNLTQHEIVSQVNYIVADMELNFNKCKKAQIMFMSMGEPMLNYSELRWSIRTLYKLFPKTQLLISTVGIKDTQCMFDIIHDSMQIKTMGLQFSVHEANEDKRNNLIPFKRKFSLRQIRDFGILWHGATKRNVYINYCVHENNQSADALNRLMDLFTPTIFNFTFSVICSADENMKEKGYHELDKIQSVQEKFLEAGYNVRIFNPAGQDDIGGGCGQLWYVQNWMNTHHSI